MILEGLGKLSPSVGKGDAMEYKSKSFYRMQYGRVRGGFIIWFLGKKRLLWRGTEQESFDFVTYSQELPWPPPMVIPE